MVEAPPISDPYHYRTIDITFLKTLDVDRYNLSSLAFAHVLQAVMLSTLGAQVLGSDAGKILESALHGPGAVRSPHGYETSLSSPQPRGVLWLLRGWPYQVQAQHSLEYGLDAEAHRHGVGTSSGCVRRPL